jgi:ABC-type spermidine/putrescine transport system permease subunit I
MESRRKRQVYITAIVSTMWLTYIIRSYAIGVILSKNGVLNELLLTVGIVSEPVFSSSGLLPVVLGMTYVFVPFAILTLYSSINNIAPELEEASKNLGADRFQTFRRVILPLSKRGVYAAWMLVFILALGAYIVPKILGDPPQWTLPVIIGDQVTLQLNVPFGAALALIMVTVVMVILALAYKFLNLGARDISGGGPSGE